MMSADELLKKNLAEHDERLKTKYTCMSCGAEDLAFSSIAPFAFVMGNDNEPYRFSTDKFIVCSDKCRRDLLVKDAAPYYTVMRNTIEDHVVPRRHLSDPYSRLETWGKSDQPYSKNIYEHISRWLSFYPDICKGWIFFGTVGTGKTSAACAIAHEMRKREKRVLFVTGTDLTLDLMCLSNERRSYNLRDDLEAFFNRYLQYDVLIIDELGDLDCSVNKNIAYSLFMKLYSLNKLLIATTNNTLDTLHKDLDDRVMSRLEHMCELLDFVGEDLRKQ